MRAAALFAASVLLASSVAAADDAAPPPECVPPPGGKCLTKEQFDGVKKALEELDGIHKSPVVVTTDDKVVIVNDWEGRVYVNGGTSAPLRMKVRIGDTVDRDVEMTLKPVVNYRPKPPDPMFRLRVRAQVGVLVPELVRTAGGTRQDFWDGGIGWDFFHVGAFNLAAYTGIRSVGGGFGVDITRNFGTYAGYALVYDDWRSSVHTGVFFAFN